jgi:UrcA family protein
MTMKTSNSSTRLRALIAAASVAALASGFATVCAAGDGDTLSVTVKYGDLNISNPKGAATLYSRLAVAARQVCGGYNISSGNFEPAGSGTDCVRKALSDAIRKVGQPELIAIYNAKHSTPLPETVASAQTR